jgi:hypothetical protein
MGTKKIRVNRENCVLIDNKAFISLLKAVQVTSKVLKEKIDYNTHVTLFGKKYVQYTGDFIINGKIKSFYGFS